MTDADKSRAEFEAWYSSKHKVNLARSRKDNYVWAGPSNAWKAWQAAREQVSQAEPESGGWIPWAGGENPVPKKLIIPKFREGSEHKTSSLSEYFGWLHHGKGYDIIAYRVVK